LFVGIFLRAKDTRVKREFVGKEVPKKNVGVWRISLIGMWKGGGCVKGTTKNGFGRERDLEKGVMKSGLILAYLVGTS